MSNKPRRQTPAKRPAGRPSSPASSRPGRSNTTTLIIIAAAVALVAILAVVIAVVVGGGDDDDETTGSTVPIQNGVADCRAVEVGPAIEAGTPDAFVAGDMRQPVAVSGTPLDQFTQEIQAGDDPDTALCRQAPVLSGFDYAGDPITIDPAADGPTLIVFLAHWCPHCNAEVPVLNEWRDSGDIPDGLNVVGVSTGVQEDGEHYPPDEWLAEVDWTWPVLADGDIYSDEGDDGVFTTAFRSYGATGFPTLAFVDANGLLRWRLSGEVPSSVIQQLVETALDTTAVADTSPADGS
ncbi:TlpA family protein disulfide reductase [Desertimonas flava]|jgi:thiol-disulfide isomerase/thioredoxin|uniref:TlpA family protein disulfide reductase n=1 Tax=Desertimonas flava TaxID=2064846 RepID=UPI000E352605|nr:TlpA disulfide reductase family protein [Desertimonas flava]